VVAAAVALPHLVDVNRYKPAIVSSVREATGRTLGLWSISFALLPAPALTVKGPITLSDAAAYPGRTALTADALSVRVGLLGLLRGRATITSFTLHHPTLTLIRDARGRWNFDDLVERASAPAPSRPASEPGGGATAVVVETARVTGGRIFVYDDAVVPGHRSQAVIGPVDATVRGWGAGTPTELDLSAGLGKSVLKARARLSAGGADSRLSVAARGQGLRAEDFLILLPWLGVARPAGLAVSGSMDLEGTADVPIERPESLRYKGSLVLNGLSYRDAGMALPLKGLSGTLTVDGDRAVWKDFGLSAGSSSLRGSLQVEDFMKPRVGFTLTSPRLDLNELIATLVPAAPAAGTPAGPAAAGAGGLLDQIGGAGRIDVKEVRFQTFDLADVKASLSLAKSVLRLNELGAAFYGGTLKGTGSVDVSRAIPAYTVATRLDRIDVEPLLAAYDPSLKGLLKGRFAGTLDLAASGAGMDAILKTARGTGQVVLTDGSLTSISVLKQLASLLEMAGGKGIGKESTPFESLKADLTIADGRAHTDDLSLHSADLDLDGKGWVGLDATLDLDVAARFSEESTRGMVAKNARLGSLAENGRLTVYFGLKGSLASPTFKLNTGAQVATAKEKAKEKVRERLKDRLLKQLGGKPGAEPTPAEPQP